MHVVFFIFLLLVNERGCCSLGFVFGRSLFSAAFIPRLLVTSMLPPLRGKIAAGVDCFPAAGQKETQLLVLGGACFILRN